MSTPGIGWRGKVDINVENHEIYPVSTCLSLYLLLSTFIYIAHKAGARILNTALYAKAQVPPGI
jgi:hypothetical protein